MMHWLTRWFRKRPPFRVEESLAAWFRFASQSGKPKGLKWVKWIRQGEPQFATDGASTFALVPVQVEFEPIPGMGMEDVPQAREPRQVTVMFVFDGSKWDELGRTIFNLTPTQVIESRCRLPGGT